MPLQELIRIFTTLNKDKIQYCHWKSNANLSKSFESETDFDLLIAGSDADPFRLGIKKLALKRRHSTSDKVYPGMEHYLGFDEASGNIFHLHVHFKLVIGKRHEKNYRIPIEDEVLNTSIWDKNYPIRTVRPELELVLLILRSILKVDFGVKTAAKVILKKDIFPSNIRKEFTFLTGKINQDIFHGYAMNLYPELSDIFIQMSQPNASHWSYFQLLKFHKRILRSLRPFRLFSNRDLESERKIKRLSSENSRSWLGPRGLSIAFVGADGSGKSTTVSHIKKWLGWKLSVRSAYMGLPKDNVLWKILVNLIRISNRLKVVFLKEQLNLVRWLFVARFRYRIYRCSEVLKNQGNMILYDRFPLKEFWDMEEPMDGPRLRDSTRWSDLERKFYCDIKYPDYIFFLKVNERESIDRKQEHRYKNLESIKKKITAIDKLIETKKDRFIVIDSTKGQERTLLEIKREIWGLF